MSFEDFQDQECLCAWINALGEPGKQALELLVTTVRTQLETAKAVWILINTDVEDMVKKEAATIVLEVYRGAVAPLAAPLSYLESQTAPFADCPPVASLSAVFRNLKADVLGPVAELDFELTQFIESIEENTAKTEWFDQLIGHLDDIMDAINQCANR